MLDNAGIPLEIIDGFIGSISVSVPWTALLSESCCMDIQGLEITIAPKQRIETGLNQVHHSHTVDTCNFVCWLLFSNQPSFTQHLSVFYLEIWPCLFKSWIALSTRAETTV